MSKSRNGEEALKNFQACFSQFGEKEVRVVYQEIQALCLYTKIPILPEDRLEEDLEVDQGTLQDLMEELNPPGNPPRTCGELALLKLDSKNAH